MKVTSNLTAKICKRLEQDFNRYIVETSNHKEKKDETIRDKKRTKI